MLSAGNMNELESFILSAGNMNELESFMLSAGDMRSWRVSCCLLEI